MYSFEIEPQIHVSALTLAACVLFGGFMGLLDDWMDLKWRYKAFMPLIAAIPLASLALSAGLRTSMSIPFIGIIDFGVYYFFVIIPLIMMVVTNTVNQLGGLNGLETICPLIVLIGLIFLSGPMAILMMGPLIVWLILTVFNIRGKIFVGNSGSFAIGITLASFAIVTDLKLSLLVSILPYVFNSALILLTVFLKGKKACLSFDGKDLYCDHRRSLVTLVAYRRHVSERKIVLIVTLLIAFSTFIAVLLQLLQSPVI